MVSIVPQLAEEKESATQYIAHHITFLTNHPAHGLLDFSVVNLDSVFFSVLLAVVFAGTFYFVARKATSGVPGKTAEFRRTGESSGRHAGQGCL